MDIKVFVKNEKHCIVLSDSGSVSDLFYIGDIERVKALYDSIKDVLGGKDDNSSITKEGDPYAVVKMNDNLYVLSIAINEMLAKGYKFDKRELSHFSSMLENFLF